MEKVVAILVSVSCFGNGFLLSEPDPGFNLLFTTNRKEVSDVPIYFEKPLPPWLNGTLIRNGFGIFENGPRKFIHSFDAFGKISSWKFFGNGSASFSSKFLQSDFYKDSMEQKNIAPYLMFETVDPPFNEFQKIQALYRGIDNMNVNIYRFYNKPKQVYEYVALNDFWKLYQIAPETLGTLRSVTANIPHRSHSSGLEFLSFISCAHPLPEYGKSNHFTFVSSVSLVPGIDSKISLMRIKSMDEREEVAQWPVKRVPYMHSFSVTPNYVIIFAAPFFLNIEKMIRYVEPFKAIDWMSTEPVNVYVIEIKTGKVTSLETDNVFTMHHINAYEQDENIIMDISAYPDPGFVTNLEMSIITDPIKRNLFDAHAYLRRYSINLKSRKISYLVVPASKKVPYSNNFDLPTINENYRSKEYCFAYGNVVKTDNVTFSKTAIVKKDLCNIKGDKSWFVQNHYPSEAWFLPSPEALTEDDGYILAPVIDGDRKQSYLVIINAVTMETVNKATLPTVVPFNLHGRFFKGVF